MIIFYIRKRINFSTQEDPVSSSVDLTIQRTLIKLDSGSYNKSKAHTLSVDVNMKTKNSLCQGARPHSHQQINNPQPSKAPQFNIGFPCNEHCFNRIFQVSPSPAEGPRVAESFAQRAAAAAVQETAQTEQLVWMELASGIMVRSCLTGGDVCGFATRNAPLCRRISGGSCGS